MKTQLITGACGFVGRHMVKRLLDKTNDKIILIDDLSTGTNPILWLPAPLKKEAEQVKIFGENERIIFLQMDLRIALQYLENNFHFFEKEYGIDINKISDVFHFAAIVGGRTKIDEEPMEVALNLGIDADFFHWVCTHRPARVLYASSSAVYPVELQCGKHVTPLSESDIDFKSFGEPDTTYGWSKLTGEYLAHITASHYQIAVACVRPFSGYGADQSCAYPIPAIAGRIARKENPVEVWGSGEQGRDFIYIDDVIDACLLAIEKISDGRAVNIGSGQLTTFGEIVNMFMSIGGYQPKIKPLLTRPVGVQKRYANLDLVKRLLDWHPSVALEEGLARVYQHAIKRFTT